MKKIAIAAAVMAMCLSAGSAAFAQGNSHHKDNDRGRGAQSQHGKQQGKHGRGAGPRNDMHKGGRLSREYRGNHYVVNDWRGHHLSRPPRGHHWVQTGGDYVLVAISSGIILSLVLH